MTQRPTIRSSVLVAISALVLFAGCAGGESGGQATHGEASAVEEPVAIEISLEAAEVLALADLADGTEDHVVEKCAGCNLAMDGSPEYALQVGDYEMHFCSDACSRRFAETAEASILELPQK